MSDNRRKLSAPDWADIMTAYSRGEKTVRDLADQYQVSRQAIHDGLKKRGVQKNSNMADVQAETEDEASKARRERVRQARQKSDQHVKFNDFLIQLLIKRIRDANEAGQISGANADVITLKNAMATLAKGRAEAWDMSKIDELLQESEELASLNVGEYTEAEIEAIKEANEEAYQQTIDDMNDMSLDFDDEDDLESDEEPAEAE